MPAALPTSPIPCRYGIVGLSDRHTDTPRSNPGRLLAARGLFCGCRCHTAVEKKKAPTPFNLSGPRWRALFFEGRALTTLPLDAEKVTHSRRICGSPRFALSAFELGMRLLLVDTNKGPDEERVGAEFPPIGHSGDAQQLHRPMPEEVRPWYEDGVTKPLDIVLRN